MPEVYDFCDLTLAGAARDCEPNVGGVARVAIAPAAHIASITIGEDGIVTAITGKAGHTTPFYPYWQRRATAVFNTTYTASDTSTGGSHQNDLAFQIAKMNAAHRAEYLKLVSGETLVLFKDNNGIWWLLGDLDNPAEATAGDGTTGQALTDYNGFNVTLSTTGRLPYEVDPEVAEALIADITTPVP